MPEPTREGQRRVVLFRREDLPEPTQHRLTAVSATLDRLVADGDIDSYSARTWDKRTQVSADDSQWARYVSFREWAQRAGVDLEPGFETRRCYSRQTGDCAEWLIYPVACIAVYEDGGLSGVYPHQDESVESIADGLASLRAADADQAVQTAIGSRASD